MPDHVLEGFVVDLHSRRIFPGRVHIGDGRITSIEEDASCSGPFIMPGFVDAHVHVESSMLPPSAFAHMSVPHGTVATVSDPHEIANVLGMAGVRYMLRDAARVPFTFWFGAPSCVPATAFETAGATLDVNDVSELFDTDGLRYLSEVMNYPGVLHGDPDMVAKIAAARSRGLRVDGHAPGMRGDDVRRYAAAGIETDHECFELDEALEKIAAGMKVLIREGSAAKNFPALHSLLATHPDRVMFCSDDKHPDDLLVGHINQIAARAIAKGYDVFDVLRAACVNPVEHYGLPCGLLRAGDRADLVVVEDLKSLRVTQTWIAGVKVADNGEATFTVEQAETPNRFEASPKQVSQFQVRATGPRVKAILAVDGQLVTDAQWVEVPVHDGFALASPSQDILKIANVNRYEDTPPAIGFIRGFGIRKGAIASSIAHDSHNIVAVGCTDQELCEAINAVIEMRGGIAVTADGVTDVLALPIAGLMSDQPGPIVAERYDALTRRVRMMGSNLHSPFMTLSFMALLVIPKLKLSDKGLFDGAAFQFTELFGP